MTSKTSAPPLGPGTACELVLLLTNTVGGVLDAAAHKAKDIVRLEEEEDGSEKSTGVEEVEKLLPVSVTGVFKEREKGEFCARVGGRASKKEAMSAQSDCASMADRLVAVTVVAVALPRGYAATTLNQMT